LIESGEKFPLCRFLELVDYPERLRSLARHRKSPSL
jgi:hypothetical protein